MRIRIIHPTTAKQSTAQADDLPAALKFDLPPGTELEATLIGSYWKIEALVWRSHATPIGNHKADESDYRRIAAMIGCDVAAVKAVVEVESRGNGFLPDGRPIILFEAHWFGRLTNQRFTVSHPSISSYEWNRELYARGKSPLERMLGEWDRLNRAIALDRPAALQSASWGMGQVMGFNYGRVGFSNIEEFVRAMHSGEPQQLEAMFRYIQSVRIDAHMKTHNWAAFAKAYNGESYYLNQYDQRLAAAYAKHARA